MSTEVIILFSGNNFPVLGIFFSWKKIKSICYFSKKMKVVLKEWARAVLGSVSTLTWAEHACLWCSSYVFCHHFCLHGDNEFRWWPRYNRVLQTRRNSNKGTEMLVFIGCAFKNPLLDWIHSQLGKTDFLGITNAHIVLSWASQYSCESKSYQIIILSYS